MKSWTDTSWIANYWIETLLTFHIPAAIVPKLHTHLEAVAQRYSGKKIFLEISQNPQENASLSLVLSGEFCEICGCFCPFPKIGPIP